LYEGGIASNRSSARCGEYFSIQVQTARQAFEIDYGGNYRDLFLHVCVKFCFTVV